MPGEVTQKAVADSIGVGPVTISRWRSGEQRPHKSNQIALINYFGLPHEIDLEVDALFLYPWPVSDAQRRTWLHQHIDRLDATTLQRLFPALERLLKDA
jgi:transcriptional regulator with XRE-family HTH domain